MNSGFLRALSISAMILGAAASARAQSATSENTQASATSGATSVPNIAARAVTAPDSAHSYDARALRFESSWGSVRLIRGAAGDLVGTSGWFRDADLERLLATSPAAVVQARLYEKNNFRGSLIGTAGALTTLIGVIVTANSSNNAASPVLIISGVGAMVWGAQHLNKSYSALSRALWWYNRDLQR